jgi:hypothetical protein
VSAAIAGLSLKMCRSWSFATNTGVRHVLPPLSERSTASAERRFGTNRPLNAVLEAYALPPGPNATT